MTIVQAQGEDDYDTLDTGAIKWEGSEAVYLEQKTVRTNNGQGSELQRRWTIYTRVSLDIPFIVGDLITISSAPRGYLPGGVAATVPIQSVDIRDSPDMPDEVCSIALIVEPAAP
jgi:hypothetical protein